MTVIGDTVKLQKFTVSLHLVTMSKLRACNILCLSKGVFSSKAEQNYPTQTGPEHCKKTSDLRCCLKAVGDVDEVMLC